MDWGCWTWGTDVDLTLDSNSGSQSEVGAGVESIGSSGSHAGLTDNMRSVFILVFIKHDNWRRGFV